MPDEPSAAPPEASPAPHPDPEALKGPELTPREWPGVVVRAAKGLAAGGGTDWAAVITYYTVLSLVPIVLAAVSILAIVGAQTIAEQAGQQAGDLIAGQASSGGGSAEEASGAIQGIITDALTGSQGAASVTFAISLLVALNGASGAFAAIGRALNVVHGVEEGRGFVKLRLEQIALAVVVILLLLVAAASFTIGGGIAQALFDLVGVGDTGRLVWAIVRIPFALAVAVFAFALLYRRAPDVHDGSPFRPFTVGALVGVVGWGLASAGFALYVQLAGFGSAFGALGGAVVLLYWLWISATTFLLGAYVDVEADRTRRLRGGGPPIVLSAATHEASAD